jgi:HEAT repeat protein
MVKDDSRETQADAGFTRDLADILVGIKRATKIFQAYPVNHPARAQALDRTQKQLIQLLAQRSPFSVQISYQGFAYGDTPVGRDHPLLHGFASEFTLRGIQAMHFLSGARPEDLQYVTELLMTDAGELSLQGGGRAFLRSRGVKGIEVDDLEMKFIEVARARVEAPPPDLSQPQEGPPPAPVEPADTPATETRPRPAATVDASDPASAEAAQQEETPLDLEALIRELHEADRPARYEYLAEELGRRAKESVGRGDVDPYLRVMAAFGRELQPTNAKPESVTRFARWTLRTVLEDTSPQPLLEGFCRGGADLHDDLAQLLLSLKDEMAQPTVDQVLIEREAGARQKLLDLLVQMGPAALPAFRSAFKSPSWETVRRLFPALPRLPAAEGTEILKRLARHYDPRIRRECIRLLGHMDVEVTGEALLAALGDADTAVRQTAMTVLGGLKVKAAVAPLRQIVLESLGTRDLEEQKTAIRALGIIGDAEAVPALVAVLQRKRLLFRRRTEELQIAAAYALGALGRPEATEALRAAAQSVSGTVREACERALKGTVRAEETEET